MLERIRDLEEEVRRAKAWEETKQRYALQQPFPGTFVYVLKTQSQSLEPMHSICANCYELGKRSILQLKTQSISYDLYECPNCKATVRATGTRPQHDLGV
jgi:hypothetical protein